MGSRAQVSQNQAPIVVEKSLVDVEEAGDLVPRTHSIDVLNLIIRDDPPVACADDLSFYIFIFHRGIEAATERRRLRPGTIDEITHAPLPLPEQEADELHAGPVGCHTGRGGRLRGRILRDRSRRISAGRGKCRLGRGLRYSAGLEAQEKQRQDEDRGETGDGRASSWSTAIARTRGIRTRFVLRRISAVFFKPECAVVKNENIDAIVATDRKSVV